MKQPLAERLAALIAEIGTVEALAEQFCELDDDSQAQFFEAVGRIMERWVDEPRSYGPSWQRFAIGRHLRTCACITSVGRRVIEEIYEAMQPEPP